MTKYFGGTSAIRNRDNSRIVILIMVVLLFLFAAVSLFILFSTNSKDLTQQPTVAKVEEAKVEPRFLDVLVPVRSLETGTKLEAPMFRFESRPATEATDRVVKSFEEVAGMYARAAIPAGEPLKIEWITKVKPANVITADIPEGFRAVSISVSATSSVEGWAAAGSHVDVLWAHRVRGQPAVTVIVQNAKVLSAERQVEANVNPGMPVPSTVTLLVTAQDAQKIQLAQTAGALNLQLRGDENAGKGGQSSTITIDELVSGGGEPAPKEERKDVIRMKRADGGWDQLIMQGGKLVPLPD